MNYLEIAQARMASAEGLPDVLAAACGAVMTVLQLIDDQQDVDGPLFDTFMMARAMAATAQLALLAAPSRPSSQEPAGPVTTESCGENAHEIAAGLARLCATIAGRLYDTALTTTGAADRHACSEASRHARHLTELFSRALAP